MIWKARKTILMYAYIQIIVYVLKTYYPRGSKLNSISLPFAAIQMDECVQAQCRRID